MPTLDEIKDDFALLDDWEDRYRYVIELGRALPKLDPALKTDATKVRGCASQVWLVSRTESDAATNVAGNDPVLRFSGESDALIVQGLVAILLAVYDGRSARDIGTLDAHSILDELGLGDHLTPQRSNGLKAMIERVRSDAAGALASMPSAR